ncbi:putative AC transposase [Vitis vinifera]|uniref:Putative AC transposase n=1 Tax=Vitis vinifera TaxID=29760 RepID=A0A438FPT7_VITVI|nr:putative AC transposase [Vitis vinifera]
MIVRDIYAIPVSTVASESAFSTGGRRYQKHRSRLHPDTLEALMCAQSWLWKEMEGDSLIHGSQFQLTIIDEDDDSLVL